MSRSLANSDIEIRSVSANEVSEILLTGKSKTYLLLHDFEIVPGQTEA